MSSLFATKHVAELHVALDADHIRFFDKQFRIFVCRILSRFALGYSRP